MVTRGVVAWVVLSAASPAWAGAGGTVDMETEYRYNRSHTLNWLTADGTCDQGGFCFRLTPVDHPRPILGRALFGTSAEALAVRTGGPDAPLEQRDLAQVNVPASPRPLVLGKHAGRDGQWFVYDLAARKYVTRSDDYRSVLAVWTGMGLSEPTFEDASVGVKHLEETWRSRANQWWPVAVLGAPVVALVLLVLGIRYARSRRRTAERSELPGD